MGDKPVTAIPGIDETAGTVLNQKGFEKVCRYSLN